MKVMGRHVLAEIHDCDMELLNDLPKVEACVLDLDKENGMTVEDKAFCQFNSEGVSGVVIIPKANMTIHTWPSGRRATVDLFTCSEELDMLFQCHSLVEKLGASHMTAESDTREIEVGALAFAV